RESLPGHPNGMRFTALDAQGAPLRSRVYYSVGGGFVVGEDGAVAEASGGPALPYPFKTAAELLDICTGHGLAISEVMLANEKVARSEADIRAGLLRIWAVMQDCVKRGSATEGILPGGLKVK